jgi:hypothetical protein
MPDSPNLTDADVARIQRDKAMDDAHDAKIERNIAEGTAIQTARQRDAAIHVAASNVGDAADARAAAAQDSAQATIAQDRAVNAEVRADSNLAGLWITIGVVVIVLIGWFIWYQNQPSTIQAAGPPITNVTVKAPENPTPSTVNVTTPTPAPVAPTVNNTAPPVTINNNMPPANSAPATNGTANPNNGATGADNGTASNPASGSAASGGSGNTSSTSP